MALVQSKFNFAISMMQLNFVSVRMTALSNRHYVCIEKLGVASKLYLNNL